MAIWFHRKGKAILAIWFHRKGKHTECGSWNDGFNKNMLPEFVMEKIRNIFEDLSSDNLLKKCLQCGTQNINKSFHNLIWDRCLNPTFVGKVRLQIAVFDGTVVFKDGINGNSCHKKFCEPFEFWVERLLFIFTKNLSRLQQSKALMQEH